MYTSYMYMCQCDTELCFLFLLGGNISPHMYMLGGNISPHIAEQRWAHQQARQREIDEVADFLS